MFFDKVIFWNDYIIYHIAYVMSWKYLFWWRQVTIPLFLKIKMLSVNVEQATKPRRYPEYRSQNVWERWYI